MFKELEVLAAQVGYRFAEPILVDGKWHVILDDEDGEMSFVGETIQEAIERATERLVAIINRPD